MVGWYINNCIFLEFGFNAFLVRSYYVFYIQVHVITRANGTYCLVQCSCKLAVLWAFTVVFARVQFFSDDYDWAFSAVQRFYMP